MPEPDLTRTPNFEAFKRELGPQPERVQIWLGRLKAWCEAAVDRIESLDHELFEARDDLIEAEALAPSYDALVATLEDWQRGVRDLPEVLEAAGLR